MLQGLYFQLDQFLRQCLELILDCLAILFLRRGQLGNQNQSLVFGLPDLEFEVALYDSIAKGPQQSC